jgi:hypothetical protein
VGSFGDPQQRGLIELDEVLPLYDDPVQTRIERMVGSEALYVAKWLDES